MGRMVNSIACLAVVLFVSVQHASGQISPGPLSKAHADLEGITNCTKCHESGHEINGTKCLECHVEIAGEIKSGHGFHFANSTSTCVTCHKEHLGADAKITKFDEAQFDHAKTGFPLSGVHASTKCEQCHQPKNIRNPDVAKVLADHPHKTFQGISPQCVTCHPDRHNGTVGQRCETCHGAKSWSPTTAFDHAKTKFALIGKHKTVECVKCHAGLVKKPPSVPVLFSTKGVGDCTPCHASPHGKKFSDKTCRSCHTAEGWSIVVSFDHASTRFPLAGAHGTVPCEKCHTEMNKKVGGTVSFVTKKFTDCTPCHASPHNARISERQCKSCHVAAAWGALVVEQFDHSLTKYTLEGKHADLRCEQCHKSPAGAVFAQKFLLPFKQCTDCHRDFHDGQFRQKYSNNCAACHTVKGFKPSTFSFQQHEEARFSLTGAHIAVPCESCHRKNGGKDMVFHFAGFRCEVCHADFHKGQFTDQMVEHSCAQCHSTVEWRMKAFDHARTKFPLTGKHRSVRCADCHKERVVNGVKSVQYVGLSLECQSCHDDIHERQFAVNRVTKCAACHRPASWHSLLFDHETQSSFHLTGAHKNVPCGGCHKEERSGTKTFIRFKPLASRCESCHLEKK